MVMSEKILVVGSMVMDLIVTTKRFCNAGETIIGTDFTTAPGGKGANQAVQAARLGADVTFYGKCGDDDFGKSITASMKASGVNTDNIKVAYDAPTAIGNVQIQKNATGTENRIIVVPGANMKIVADDVADLKNTISNYDMVIMQNETPMETNLLVAEYAKAAGVPVMLNPAPASKIPAELIACLTYISPNEHEAAEITGISITDDDTLCAAIKALHDMGAKNVIITLGKNGCAFSDGNTIKKSPCSEIEQVIDPTAAGDSFIGAFCTAVASGVGIEDALVFANYTAGITVSRMGAQTSLPTFNEVVSVMDKKGLETKVYSW